jgi:hypothetical protein
MNNDTNPNANLDPQDPLRELIQIQPRELEPKPFDGFGGCWPGDGSGMDDLADFNQMEGCDM